MGWKIFVARYSFTNTRFTHAKKPSKFLITECDYKNIVSDDSDDEPTINTSPDKYKHSTKEELFLKISTGLLNILTSASKKKISPKNSRLEKSVRLKAFRTLFPHSWTLSTKQLILSSIIYKTCMSSTNKKLHIPQWRIKRENLIFDDSDNLESNKSATTSNSESSSNKKKLSKKKWSVFQISSKNRSEM